MGESRTVVALACALVLLVSGCGGEDAPDAAPAETATVTATATVTEEASPTDEPTDEVTEEADPGDDDDSFAGPTSYRQALRVINTGPQSLRVLQAWQSPSGNLHCLLDDNGFDGACEVLEGRIEDPEVCTGGAGEPTVGRIAIQGGEVVPVCNTDTIVNPSAPVLEYGTTARTEGFITCHSARTGMTCVNTDIRKGFFLARGVYFVLD